MFASPRRLRLRLLCTPERRVKMMLDVWPKLPIVISAHLTESRGTSSTTNIIGALRQRNRVYQICLRGIPNSLLRRVAATKGPFPALTDLELWSSCEEGAPVLSDSFLAGSAPRLLRLEFWGIPFTGLGKLLLSTGDLVYLHLWDIPPSGYIPSEALVNSLAALSKLKELSLGFRSPRRLADQPNRQPPPLTRLVLPALTSLLFQGNCEYLEDIVSQINAPLLDNATMTFFNQLIFDAPFLRHFISRTEAFEAPHRANLVFSDEYVNVTLFERKGTADREVLQLGVSCRASDWQLSSISQVFSSSLPPFVTLERLEIHNPREDWQDDMDSEQWLELLYPLTSVKDLVLGRHWIRRVAPALQELARERSTEVLPALQNLFFEGKRPPGRVKEVIQKLIAARQLSGRPVALHWL